jgi:rhodanese-related sulfurtransferase
MAAISELTPAQAAERLGEFQPIDVRGAMEWHGPLGRIGGAQLIPLPELAARVAEIPTNRALLLVCRSGARSAKACAQLAELGFAPVVNLAGGMIAWQRARLPVERTAPASRAELLESAVAWLAQVTAQSADAARARLEAELSGDLADVARALDAIRELAGTPPDLDLSLAAFRAALAEL